MKTGKEILKYLSHQFPATKGHLPLRDMMRDYDRAAVLLRAARDLISTAGASHYVMETESITVRYDDANGDGYCLREDIETLLDIPSETPVHPISHEEDF